MGKGFREHKFSKGHIQIAMEMCMLIIMEIDIKTTIGTTSYPLG